MTTQFKERLLEELKSTVTEAPARRRFGRKPLFATVGALVGAAVVIAVPSLMAGSASAYEITHHGDKVTVEFPDLRHPKELAQALNDHGIKTVVRYNPDDHRGWMCSVRYKGHSDPDAVMRHHRPQGTVEGFSFRVSDLHGKPLVLSVNKDGTGVVDNPGLPLRCNFK